MYSTILKKLLSLLTVFAMVFSMIAVVQPLQASAATVEIAIPNGDFENGAFGGAVSASNGASIVTKATYEGNYALKFDATGKTLTVTGYLAEATTAESTVTLSFWAKVLSGSTGNSVNFGLFATNESWGNRVQKYGAGYPVPGGDWKQITQALAVPAGTKIIQAQIYLGSEGTTAIVDNVSITDGNGNEILQSGGFEKGALNGDFNANDALELVFTPVHSGNYAAHADKSSGNGNISTTVSFEPSSEARTMQFSYWMYAPTSANGAHNMVVCFDTSNGSWTNLSTKYGAQYATPGQWVQKTMEIAVAANTNTLQIQLYAQDAGADFYIDDMTLTEEVAQVNHDVTLSLNQVTGDGTWQFSISEAPANKYYKVPATIDGVACNFLMGESGGIMCVYPNFFTALGGAVPTQQIIIEEGAVLKAVDSTNGWKEIEGADTYTLTEKIDLSYVDGAWSKTVYTTDVTLSLNQVTGDGTWQFSISEAPANKYYKVPATIDGVACNFLMGESGGIMCVYPNFFTALGGAVPTQQIIIEEGTVLKAVDSTNGWKEIEGADTYTLTEKIDLSYVDGAWSKTVYTTDVTLSLNQVTGDGTWQFSISEVPAENYYKVPAIIDGVACNFLMGKAGDIMCVYPNFFTALGGAVPTQQIIIEEGTVLKAVDSTNGWQEIEGATALAVSEKIDLSYVNGAWSKTVYTTDVEVSFNQVTGDGTWQFGFTPAPANKYYKIPAIVDGTACNILMGESGGVMCVYPNFFPALGGAVPAESLVIEEGAVLKAVDSANGWQEIQGADALVVTNSLSVVNNLGSWLDMSAYADVTFAELKASDLNVYKAEDQSADHYRSVFAISSAVAIGNDGWGNFTEVASKVLIDGIETDVVFGMAPAAESSWGNESAFLLYITGEGYWDAVTTASSVTICAGTMIVSNLDTTKGFMFAEDFVIYRNEDGSWDTTEDPTIAKQEITISLQTITGDGTWQMIPSTAPANTYYKAAVIIDGTQYDVLVQYGSEMLLIYDNFFTAVGGVVPTESFVIPAGTMMKAMELSNGWQEIEDSLPLLVTEELRIENIAGKWVEMSKYADVTFTEIYAADLDVYYQNIMRLGDFSPAEIAIAKLRYPEIADLIEIYGDDANMTTFGIYSVIPTLQIPNDANWSTFQLLGTITVNDASPVETYVMQTPDSSDDAETAMTNGFLVRFYNGFVADVATSITIEPGTRIVTKDGTAGFVFVDGYTIYRDENGNWSDIVPEGVNPVNKWGLTLGDNIGVSFEMNVNTGDVVSFTVNGNPVTAEQNGKTYTVYVAAAQMTDDIVISVNGAALEKTYSVRGYADIILAGTYGEKTKELVRQMLNYGAAAQTYFDHNTGSMANAGIEVTAAVPTGSTEIAVTDTLSGFAFYGASLIHKTKTAVRFYFTAESIEGLNFTVNGDEVEANAKDNLYYIELGGINPQDMGAEIAVEVTNGTDSLSVAYSPLTYIVRMYEKGSETTQALVQALYGYYLAAEAYTA